MTRQSDRRIPPAPRACLLLAATLPAALLFCGDRLVATPAGTDLVIMIDMSMNIAIPGAINLPSQNVVRILTGGSRLAAAELDPGDQVGIVTFSGSAKTTVPMTTNFATFEAALRKTGAWTAQTSEHRLYDSLLTVLNGFPEEARTGRRSCILVFTTTSDAASRHTVGEVVAVAKSKQISISIALVAPPDSPVHVLAGQVRPKVGGVNENEERKTLNPLTTKTGGAIGVYQASPYVIATAIEDMIKK